MAFSEIFKRGVEAVSKGVNTATQKAKDKKAAMTEFDLLKTRSEHIGPMKTYEVKNTDPQIGKEQMILNACLTLNVENAKLINRLLPIDETVVDIKTSKESKTEIVYNFIITDKRLWVMNKNEYITFEFDDIKTCEIVNKGLMAQGVNFNGMAFVIDGRDVEVERFLNILKKPDYRMEATSRKIQYLLGVTPRKQFLNMNLKGITFGDTGTIVLHNTPDSKIINIKDLDSVELLINDVVTIKKGKTDSTSFMSTPLEARKMSVKFIFGLSEYTIDTMPQNMMNTTYKREEQTYIANYEFSKNIVDTVAALIKKFQ